MFTQPLQLKTIGCFILQTKGRKRRLSSLNSWKKAIKGGKKQPGSKTERNVFASRL